MRCEAAVAEPHSADGRARRRARPARRGRLIARVELHLAASTPLFGLLAWRLWARPWFWVFLALAALGLVLLLLVLMGARLQQPDPFEFEEIVDLGDQVAGHVVGYLLPFLVASDATTSEVWLTLAVLAVLSVIQVESNLVHLNPVLYLIGYRIYSAVSGGNTYYLIARSELSDLKGTLLAAEIPGRVLVEKGRRR